MKKYDCDLISFTFVIMNAYRYEYCLYLRIKDDINSFLNCFERDMFAFLY